MTAGAPFTWLESNGWLVLSGPPDALSEIRARALSRYEAVGAIAYVSLAGDQGDALMDDMAELGAPTGYLVDLEGRDNNAIYERLSGAGMIVIEAGERVDRLRRLMTRTATSALKTALAAGALILFEGPASSIAGERSLTAGGELAPGLNLVRNAVIAPRAVGVAVDDPARALHRDMAAASVIGLAPGSALALGPNKQIETWGEGDVTISLGELARAGERFRQAK